MGILNKFFKRKTAGNEQIPTFSEFPPQINEVIKLFLYSSRNFYQQYENIMRSISKNKRSLSKVGQFETTVFFLFLVDIQISRSGQNTKMRELLFDTFLMLIFAAAEYDSLGGHDTLTKVVNQRFSDYAQFVNKSESKDPGSIFTGLFNPLYNNIEAFRDNDNVTEEKAPVVVGDIFESVSILKALQELYLREILPFRFALKKLFEGNENFTVLSESEVVERIEIGIKEASTYNKE